MTKKRNYFLSLILVLAFFLRFYRIGEVPPSLNWDEVSIGYNAYSILETGKDEWGQFMPVHFKSFGEYKLPLQIYFSIPSIALFELNPFAVRLTPVIYGTLTVLFLYFLTKELFDDERVSLVSAFLLAVSPWHVQLTRGSFESSFALMWVVLGFWFLLKGFKKEMNWVPSAIFFAAAIYTYNSARAFVPLALFLVALFYLKRIIKNKKGILIGGVIFIVLMLPLVPFVVSGEVSERYRLVSVTDEPGLVPRIEEQRNLSTLPPLITRLVHNRPVYITVSAAKNYLAHFTPDFLFISGAGHRQHHVQNIGELYWIQAPFLIVGLYFLFKKKQKYLPILLVWVLTAFIPVSLTLDSIPHALRTLNAAPVYQIITAFGFVTVLDAVKRRKKVSLSVGVVSLFIFGVQFVGYMQNLFVVYPVLYSRDWQYGNKQVVEFINENYDKYDEIVYTRSYGEPHIFTLFYLNYPPGDFQENPNLERFETYDWIRVLRFDKFYFPDLNDEGTRYEDIVEKESDKNLLFIGEGDDFPEDLPRLKQVNFLNGERAFDIVEFRGM